MKKFAIACMSGSLKAVFIHGVLAAFEESGFIADAYAACSASTLPASFAAAGQIRNFTEDYWAEGSEITKQPGNSMSNFVLDGIDRFAGTIVKNLNEGKLKRLLIACSYVKSEEAAIQAQGKSAVTLGRKLIIYGARHISDWKDEHLELHVFDTESVDKNLKLTAENYRQVAYATTRMLHAWHIPAEINSKPYIDGSYTCLLPVNPLVELGYKNIIAITTEPGNISKDFFSSEIYSSTYNGSTIYWVKPGIDLKKFGVDFTKADFQAVKNTFNYGRENGFELIYKLEL